MVETFLFMLEKTANMKSLLLLLFLAALCPFSHAQTRRFINPPGQNPPGYSHTVEVSGGRTIYVSGQVAMDASGAVVGQNDFRAEVKQVFENLKTVLAASGATLDDVVKFTYYVATTPKSSASSPPSATSTSSPPTAPPARSWAFRRCSGRSSSWKLTRWRW
jgi:enamine deaminase RidA (YjgF/YER057c/UK114 family)